MKRGLVIGKFMPLHQGHIALIRFAAAQCDELIVSMTYTLEDPIPGFIRFEWIEEEFKEDANIHPEVSLDDFDDATLPMEKRIPRWAAFLKRRFSNIDVIISSEEYGLPLSRALSIPHVSFDPARKKFPISATSIREKPIVHWDFIAKSAQPYFVKKICLYGPESTGKSTMAKKLAAYYKTEFVPEVSRDLIDSNDFTIDDIIKIGEEQTVRVVKTNQVANKLLFCDTDLITTEIYCRHYLKEVPEILYDLESMVTYDQYFLMDIDTPWIADGLRDLGERRLEMFNVFKAELEKRKISYELIRGDYTQREAQMVKKIDQFFV